MEVGNILDQVKFVQKSQKKENNKTEELKNKNITINNIQEFIYSLSGIGIIFVASAIVIICLSTFFNLFNTRIIEISELLIKAGVICAVMGMVMISIALFSRLLILKILE